MKIDAICTPFVCCVRDDEPVIRAAELMRFNEVGALAVFRRANFVGIISERDITRVLADGVDPHGFTVSDYMTADPVCAGPEDDAIDAATTMLAVGVRHLPVIEAGRLVGMVSIRDVVADLAAR